MMRSCHGLLLYFKPVGQEPVKRRPGFSALMRAMSAWTSGKPSDVPGSGSATRTELPGNVRGTSFDAALLPHGEVATTRAKRSPEKLLSARINKGSVKGPQLLAVDEFETECGGTLPQTAERAGPLLEIVCRVPRLGLSGWPCEIGLM